jgi:Flp pilus assembly protein TadD
MNAAPDWEIWNIGLLLVSISILCLCMLPRKPFLAVGWFWYLGTSIPIIGLVQVGETAMADRYTYLPLIGPVLALIWLISDMGRSKILQKKLLGGTAIVVLVALAILTRQQLHYWKNTVSLFEHAIEVTGANASAQSGLGIALEKEGRTREAMMHYRISLALNPEDFQTYYNLGQLLVQREDWGEAEKLFFNVLYRNPDDFNAHLTLGMVLPHLGRDLEARKHLETALNLQPDSTEAVNNLAWSLATSDDPELRNGTRAVMLAERACELTHYEKTRVIGTLAAAYAEAGRYEEAIATAEKACAQARKNNESDLFQKNLELLRLYRSEQPCRDLPAKVAPDKR